MDNRKLSNDLFFSWFVGRFATRDETGLGPSRAHWGESSYPRSPSVRPVSKMVEVVL